MQPDVPPWVGARSNGDEYGQGSNSELCLTAVGPVTRTGSILI